MTTFYNHLAENRSLLLVFGNTGLQQTIALLNSHGICLTTTRKKILKSGQLYGRPDLWSSQLTTVMDRFHYGNRRTTCGCPSYTKFWIAPNKELKPHKNHIKTIKIINTKKNTLVPSQASNMPSPHPIPAQGLGQGEPSLQCWLEG